MLFEVRLPNDIEDDVALKDWLVQENDEIDEGAPFVRLTTKTKVISLTLPCYSALKEKKQEAGDRLNPGDTLAIIEA